MFRRVVILAAAALAVPAFAVNAEIPEASALVSGAAYIKSIQNADGAYGTSDLGQNIDAVIAVRAAGYDPAKDLAGGKGPGQFLAAGAAGATSPAAAAKAALGVTALGLDPRAFGGVDLIDRVNDGYDAAKGTYGADDFSQSIAMLGLACTDHVVPPAAATALKSTQMADTGGWGFGGIADPDTTAIAIQALLASGTAKSDPAVVKGLAYLKTSQGNDGGWGFDPSESNASSTAYVIQALIALGENPEAAAYEKSGVNPVEFLVSQQQADGSFKGFDAAYATNQALPALAGRTFCNAPETPITRTRAASSPTPAASPTPRPATPPAVAPKPPSTGTGAGTGDGADPVLYAAIALLLGSASTLAAVRLKRR